MASLHQFELVFRKPYKPSRLGDIYGILGQHPCQQQQQQGETRSETQPALADEGQTALSRNSGLHGALGLVSTADLRGYGFEPLPRKGRLSH